MVSLEERFNSRPSDVADQRHRDGLIRYVAVLLYSHYSYPSSKLDVLGGAIAVVVREAGVASAY